MHQNALQISRSISIHCLDTKMAQQVRNIAHSGIWKLVFHVVELILFFMARGLLVFATTCEGYVVIFFSTETAVFKVIG
jgi:hypothetical protein